MIESFTKNVLRQETYHVTDPRAPVKPPRKEEDVEFLERRGAIRGRRGNYNVSFAEIPQKKNHTCLRKFLWWCAITLLCKLFLLLFVLYFIYFVLFSPRITFSDLTDDCKTNLSASLIELENFENYLSGEFARSYASHEAICSAFKAFRDNEKRMEWANQYSPGVKIFGPGIFTDWSDDKRRKMEFLDDGYGTYGRFYIESRYTTVSKDVDWSLERPFDLTSPQAGFMENFFNNYTTLKCKPDGLEIAGLQFLQMSIRKRTANATNFLLRPVSQDCQSDISPLYSGHLNDTKEIVYGDIMNNEIVLKMYLKAYGPAMTKLMVPLEFFDYSGGIINQEQCTPHGDGIVHLKVIVVGYGTEKNVKYWKFAGWWGQNWGEHGFFRISRENNTCKINYDPARAIEERMIKLV